MKNKTVVAFGTFDLLHEGHKFYLRKAKGYAEKLIVVIARDATVEKIKGKKPLHNERERRAAVRALDFVDDALLGNAPAKAEKYAIVQQLKPDVIALGHDQEANQELLEKFWKGTVVRIASFKKEKFNSSLLREKYLNDKDSDFK